MTAGLVFLSVVLSITGCTSAPPSQHPSASTSPVADDVASTEAAVEVADPDALDAWAHHFDAAAQHRVDSPYGSSWGTFGVEGAVVPVGTTFASVPAGAHSVVIQCAGPASVDVTVATTDSVEHGAPHRIDCTGTATLSYTTTADGIDVTIDSHGAQGAWLMDITS